MKNVQSCVYTLNQKNYIDIFRNTEKILEFGKIRTGHVWGPRHGVF